MAFYLLYRSLFTRLNAEKAMQPPSPLQCKLDVLGKHAAESLYLLYPAKSPLPAPGMDSDSPIKMAAFCLPTFKNHLAVLNNNPVAVWHKTATDNRKEKQ